MISIVPSIHCLLSRFLHPRTNFHTSLPILARLPALRRQGCTFRECLSQRSDPPPFNGPCTLCPVCGWMAKIGSLEISYRKPTIYGTIRRATASFKQARFGRKSIRPKVEVRSSKSDTETAPRMIVLLESRGAPQDSKPGRMIDDSHSDRVWNRSAHGTGRGNARCSGSNGGRDRGDPGPEGGRRSCDRHAVSLGCYDPLGEYTIQVKLYSPAADREVLLALKRDLLDRDGFYALGKVRIE
jgi:hypothetical protein